MSNTSDRHDKSPSNDNAEIRVLTQEIMRLFSELEKRIRADEEKQWLKEHCHNPLLLKILDDVTVMMLHVTDAVGELQPVNGITVSKHMEVPKGTVSKIARKLTKMNLTTTETLPNNRKEVLFRLTPLGDELFHLHRSLHQQIDLAVFNFFAKYDSNELHFIIRFLEDALESPWIEQTPT
jgi:DNA-binding MarR family transcriptional regulator